jgi:hypothetical protein
LGTRRRPSGDIQRKIEAHRLWRSTYFSRGERADFTGCDLRDADLHNCDLSGARFRSADLRGAYLVDAIFHGNNLHGANLAGAVMFDTVLRRVDLSETHGLDQVVHHGPSTVGIDTILRSRGRIPPQFLVGAGVPRAAVPSLLSWARRHSARGDFYSAFISYGGPDERFAVRLSRTLSDRGVQTFCFAEHAEPGAKLFELMHTKANDYDRVLLVCSKRSLGRPGLLNELDEVLRREAREGGGSILVPIAIDDYVYAEWTPRRPAMALAVRDRVIADFRQARSAVRFRSAMEKLLEVLRRSR